MCPAFVVVVVVATAFVGLFLKPLTYFRHFLGHTWNLFVDHAWFQKTEFKVIQTHHEQSEIKRRTIQETTWTTQIIRGNYQNIFEHHDY